MRRRTPKYKAPPRETWMTPEQLAHSELVKEAQEKVAAAETYLGDLVTRCKHAFAPLTDEMRKELKVHSYASWKYDRASCFSCEFDFGWRCPSSPDSVCHYQSMHSRPGFVKLVDDTEVPVPDGHDIEYETDDSCIFCHAPDERK